jgi:hypothetical protein
MTIPARRQQYLDYIARRLTPIDGEEIDRELFLSDEFFGDFLDRETEVLRDLASGRLSGAEKEIVERHVASSSSARAEAELCKKLEKRAMADAEVGKVRPLRRRILSRLGFPYLAAAAGMAFCLMGAVLLWNKAQPRKAVLELSPSHRSPAGEMKVVPTGSAADLVELRLELDVDDAFESFRVVISQGHAVAWTADVSALPRRGHQRVVDVVVPMSKLHAGEYEVVLRGPRASGYKLLGFYDFRIGRPRSDPEPPFLGSPPNR